MDTQEDYKNNPAGTVILCEKAVRDEGVSYHYLPEEMYAYASDKMTNAIRVSLDNMNIPMKMVVHGLSTPCIVKQLMKLNIIVGWV